MMLSKMKSKRKSKANNKMLSTGDIVTPNNIIFSTGQQEYILTLPKSVRNFFPSRYRAWGTTAYTYTQAATIGDSLTFKLNGNFNLFGPRINNTGSFGSNVPSGSQFLIGSDSVSGATTPYTRALVLRQEVEVSALSDAANAMPTLLYITFGTNLTNAGMSLTAIQEQPLTSFTTIPAVTNAGPIICQAGIDPWVPLGVNRTNYFETREYGQVAGVDPAALGYILIGLRSLDGTTACSYVLSIRFRTYFEFSEQNAFASTAPSLSQSAPMVDVSSTVSSTGLLGKWL